MNLQEEWLIKFNEGDEGAFKLFYDKTFKFFSYYIQKLAFKMNIFSPTSEEITIDSYLKLFINRKKIESYNHAKAFIHITGKNEIINLWRSRKKIVHYEDINNVIDFAEETIENHEKNIKKEEFLLFALEELQKKLQIPERKFEVIRLLILKGKKTSEVAEILQINKQTVLNHKTRCLGYFRSILNTYLKQHSLSYKFLFK